MFDFLKNIIFIARKLSLLEYQNISILKRTFMVINSCLSLSKNCIYVHIKEIEQRIQLCESNFQKKTTYFGKLFWLQFYLSFLAFENWWYIFVTSMTQKAFLKIILIFESITSNTHCINFTFIKRFMFILKYSSLNSCINSICQPNQIREKVAILNIKRGLGCGKLFTDVHNISMDKT